MLTLLSIFTVEGGDTLSRNRIQICKLNQTIYDTKNFTKFDKFVKIKDVYYGLLDNLTNG